MDYIQYTYNNIRMTKPRDLLVQVVCLFLATHQGEGNELDSWLGEDCAIDGYNNTKITRQDNGQYVCCVALTCPQGTFAVACTESDPSTTHCKECEDDTYMDTESLSTDSFKCEPRRMCSAQRGLIRIDEGSIVQDAECQCDLKRGYHNSEGLKNPTYCRGPKQCPAGEELTMDGDCRLCRPGMFKVSKGFASCQFWTHCEMLGFIIGEHGNRTANSTCVTAGVTTVALTEMPTTDSKMKEWPSPRPRPRPGPRKVRLVFGVLVPLLMLLFLLPLYLGTVRRRRRKHTKRERLTDDCGKESDKVLGSALLSQTWITDPEREQKSLVHPHGTKNEDDRKKNVIVHVLLPRVSKPICLI